MDLMFKSIIFGLFSVKNASLLQGYFKVLRLGECIFHYRLKNMGEKNERLTEDKRSISKVLEADELMNYFWGMLDLRTAGSHIFRKDQNQDASLSRLPNTPRWKSIPDH